MRSREEGQACRASAGYYSNHALDAEQVLDLDGHNCGGIGSTIGRVIAILLLLLTKGIGFVVDSMKLDGGYKKRGSPCRSFLFLSSPTLHLDLHIIKYYHFSIISLSNRADTAQLVLIPTTTTSSCHEGKFEVDRKFLTTPLATHLPPSCIK